MPINTQSEGSSGKKPTLIHVNKQHRPSGCSSKSSIQQLHIRSIPTPYFKRNCAGIAEEEIICQCCRTSLSTSSGSNRCVSAMIASPPRVPYLTQYSELRTIASLVIIFPFTLCRIALSNSWLCSMKVFGSLSISIMRVDSQAQIIQDKCSAGALKHLACYPC